MVAMARPIRIEYENAAYHVTARGNERRAIFRDDKDRTCFLRTLEQAAGRFGLVIQAYCLMPNHYHLLYCGQGKVPDWLSLNWCRRKPIHVCKFGSACASAASA